MGRNGVWEPGIRIEIPLTEEQVDAYRRLEAANMLAVFGAARLAMSPNDIPSHQQIDDLTWQIEELCAGPYGQSGRGGVHRRELTGDRESQTSELSQPIGLTWNPAGTRGGFGIDSTWDGAVANASHITIGKQRSYRFAEGLYIPRGEAGVEASEPMIRRILWDPRGHKSRLKADKPATTQELDTISATLIEFAEIDVQSRQTNETIKKPIYLEIGHGIDPSAVLGRRVYRDREYKGVDYAVGDYQNPLAPYPEAVRTQSTHYAELVADQRTGEYISFEIGDAQDLAMPSASVREVFMSNVLNAPLDDDARTNILHEAGRVLERHCNLVVRVNWHQDKWPESKMIHVLEDAGFYVSRSVSYADVEYSRLEAQYGTPVQVPAPGGYYLIAQASRVAKP